MTARRTVLSVDPPNAEAHLHELRSPVTPLDAFYVRSNFTPPDPLPDASDFRLRIGGRGVDAELGLDDLRALGERTRRVTLECAGNGRTFLDPPVEGTSWTLGGTGTADFGGVPLARVLRELGVATPPVEVVFTGGDRGEAPGWGEIPFQRSLPGDVALDEDGPLLAWSMNGEPLRREHGAPLRLVVPGWYAVASVKWLVRIDLLDHPFEGYYQTDRYRYLQEGRPIEPVRAMRVRGLLLSPDPERDRTVDAGPIRLEGIAWTGRGAPVRVEVSTDGGATWSDAELAGPEAPFTPARWALDWDAAPGTHEVVVRAHDDAGAQPLEQAWNELGYGNNVVQRVVFTVR